MTTMADLTHGTRIRHVRLALTGIIRQWEDCTEIHWDDIFGEIQVSDEGPVFPVDVEILQPGGEGP